MRARPPECYVLDVLQERKFAEDDERLVLVWANEKPTTTSSSSLQIVHDQRVYIIYIHSQEQWHTEPEDEDTQHMNDTEQCTRKGNFSYMALR